MLETNRSQLVDDLKRGGIRKGDLVHVKLSMKAVGKVKGGAAEVIESLLEAVGEEGTIVADAFINVYEPNQRKVADLLAQNQKSYAGWFVNEMIAHPRAFRSAHPIQRFVAIGYKAKQLTENHTFSSHAYGLLKEMTFEGGKNLKIGDLEQVPGVGTTHVAICDLKFTQRRLPLGVYHHQDGNLKFFIRNWVGGCARGFNKLIPHYNRESILYKGKFGKADLLITDMRGTYESEMRIIADNPKSFLCDNPKCVDCRLSWEFSNESYVGFMLRNMLNFNLRTVSESGKLLLKGISLKG